MATIFEEASSPLRVENNNNSPTRVNVIPPPRVDIKNPPQIAHGPQSITASGNPMIPKTLQQKTQIYLKQTQTNTPMSKTIPTIKKTQVSKEKIQKQQHIITQPDVAEPKVRRSP